MGRRTWRQRHKAGLFKRGQTPHNAGIKYHDTGVKTKTILVRELAEIYIACRVQKV